MIECPQCGLRSASEECPSCGYRLRPSSSSPVFSGNPVEAYFRQVIRILFHPTEFFRAMPVTGGLSGPLAFALVSHWVGAALAYLWFLLIGGAVKNFATGFFKIAGDIVDVDHPGRSAQIFDLQNRALHWVWGAGSVIADPFFTLASILFTTVLVFIGARLLISGHRTTEPRQSVDASPSAPVTFEACARIVCYGMTPALLSGLPILGGVVSTLIVTIVTIIGVREVFQIAWGRAIIVALFPRLLLLAIILLGMLLFAAMIIKLIGSAFSM